MRPQGFIVVSGDEFAVQLHVLDLSYNVLSQCPVSANLPAIIAADFILLHVVSEGGSPAVGDVGGCSHIIVGCIQAPAARVSSLSTLVVNAYIVAIIFAFSVFIVAFQVSSTNCPILVEFVVSTKTPNAVILKLSTIIFNIDINAFQAQLTNIAS